MQQTVESNRTLLVDGPASVKLVSGEAEIFGFPVKPSHKVVVRQGKRLPFFVQEKTAFDVSLGPNAKVEEAVGTTIPNSWNKPLEAITGLQKKPLVFMVLGKNDSGKSSFCTYLVNKLVQGKCRVAVLDGDLGQSDIGSSGTVGYAVTSKPVPELYDLKLENAAFLGVTSPMMAIAETIKGLADLKAEILQMPLNFVVINTDGWVSGDVAMRYKASLIKELTPDIIVGVQVAEELEELIAALELPVIRVDSSPSLNQRTAEKRKSLREMTYARYLKDSKLQCYPMNQLKVEPRKAIPTKQTSDRGLLVGLYGLGSRFLGIGILREINQVRRVLKVQTAVEDKPRRLVIGQVVLDEKLREVQD